MQKLHIWLVAIAIVGSDAGTHAQGVFDMGVLTNTVSIPTRAAPRSSPARRDYTPGERAVAVASGSFERPRMVASAGAGLPYTPTATVRRRAVAGYVGRISREYPDAAKTVAEQLARHDYSAIYSGLMRGAGLRDNDAADAVVAYTLLGWQIVNQDPAEISPAKVAAARRQIAPALAANPQFADPTVRADLGEEMKLLFVTLHAGWQSAQKEGNTGVYSDGIARMWQRQSGRDLHNVRLTNEGFSRRG